MEHQMIRTSERRSFKRCPQAWWWSWQEGLASREPSKALWFGTGWHEVMADYYRLGKKRSKDYIDVWRHYCDTPDADGMYQTVDDMGEEWMDLKKLGEVMLDEYVKHYQGDKSWDVIATEYSGEVLIPSNDETRKIQYNFTFDGVYRDTTTKKIMLMEHKTAKSISVNHLSLDDQAGSYWAVAPTILRANGILTKKENVRGIMYNFVRKGMPDNRPVGADGYARNKPAKIHFTEALDTAGVEYEEKWGLPKLTAAAEGAGLEVLGDISKNQPTPLFKREAVLRTVKERRTQINRIKNEADHMFAIQNGTMPLYKSPSRDCSWCQFFNMCEVHDAGGDYRGFGESVFKQVDRYADHRKSAGDA